MFAFHPIVVVDDVCSVTRSVETRRTFGSSKPQAKLAFWPFTCLAYSPHFFLRCGRRCSQFWGIS